MKLSHELYIYNNTLDMFKNFAPQLGGRYLSSNVNITFTDKHGKVVNTPVGDRFRKFKTERYVYTPLRSVLLSHSFTVVAASPLLVFYTTSPAMTPTPPSRRSKIWLRRAG